MSLNFSGQNLQGCDFKGRDMTGADFSRADIRGANFTNAILKKANFSNAKAGLQHRWVIGLLIVSLILSAIPGFIAVYAGYYVVYFFIPTIRNYNPIAGIVLLSSLAIVSIVVIRKGLDPALGVVVAALASFGAIAVAFAGGAIVVAFPIAFVGAFAGAVAFAFTFAGAIAVAGTRAGAVAGSGAVAGAIAFAVIFPDIFKNLGAAATFAFVGALADAVIFMLLSGYVAWYALQGAEKYALIRSMTVAFAAIGGTSFRGADLTDANFTQAKLKSTDFREANVTRTYWYQARMLDLARIGTTYLKNSRVRKLVITGQGQDRSFNRLDLRGVNLHRANLVDASFIGADLSEANLQDADLSRAKLVQTQLDRTDLTGATLTGAYIEDWGITSETKLDGVSCEYVYMRLPTKDDPDPCRKPDNKQEMFEDGDFADFIQPIFNTLDLYHNQGVDPRAIAISFKQLAEHNPEAELEIVAMEKRGWDKFLLRAKTVSTADKSELSQEYFTTYNRLKALPEREIKLLLAEKDSRIHSLESMVVTALQRPNFYAETYQHQGDIMSDKSSEIKIGDVSGGIGAFAGGDISGVAGQNMTGVAGGDISGTVTATIGQLEKSNAPEAPKLADLLKKLQTAIESDANLSEEDKAEALEQVKVLAEVGKAPKEGTMQKTAKTAIRALKGIISDLPAVATLVEASKTLLPTIAALLSLA